MMKHEFPIYDMTAEDFNIMLDNKKDLFDAYEPKGLFIITEDNGSFTGVDNMTGDAWTENFKELEKCVSWLRGEFEVMGPDEIEIQENEFDQLSASLPEYLNWLIERTLKADSGWDSGYLQGNENICYEFYVYAKRGEMSWRIYHSWGDEIISRGNANYEDAIKKITEDMGQ